jgi:ABC-2 type transport system permease protein
VGSRRWRSFRTAAWLGWQIESNWTDPFLFLVYSIAKPLAVAAILVMMFGAITHGDFTSPTFVSMYVGNAFYVYVGAVMTGMGYAVLDDRERYKMLKSVYVAPIDVRYYLAGRGAARFLNGTVSVVVILAIGVIFLHVPIRADSVDWLLLTLTMMAGIVMLALLGLALAGLLLLLGQFSWSLGEAAAGTLLLFSGAIFPVDTLPAALRPIGFVLPLAGWLELVRRSVTPGIEAFGTFHDRSTVAMLGLLVGQTIALGIVADVVFHICDRVARERGLIDRTSNY